ncbi:hypothetical protein [Amycolatopsis benzoatilytica]|uniref:hypothetical protein n=1 Tax=Amycolatopsis benzoatilytica TaxID=346045 RepID=UPI00036B7B78|nr:hypothetical protein [Amycolatopsis benzoatilytica]
MTASGLAVLGDGSALPGGVSGDPGAVSAALESDVQLLRNHTMLTPYRVAVTARDAGELAVAARAVAENASAIFLARTEAARARAVQQDFARTGRVLVVTEQDTLAIGLVAAVLVILRRTEVAPLNARVVVTAPSRLPLLVPLLMAVGVADIASWNEADASGFPLSSVSRDASVVVDLIGAATGLPRVVAAREDPVAHLLALPGLLYALGKEPIGGCAGDPMGGLDAHRAAVHALVTLTPVDRIVPDLADPDLSYRVARAVLETRKPAL